MLGYYTRQVFTIHEIAIFCELVEPRWGLLFINTRTI